MTHTWARGGKCIKDRRGKEGAPRAHVCVCVTRERSPTSPKLCRATYLSVAGVGPVLLKPRNDVPEGRDEVCQCQTAVGQSRGLGWGAAAQGAGELLRLHSPPHSPPHHRNEGVSGHTGVSGRSHCACGSWIWDHPLSVASTRLPLTPPGKKGPRLTALGPGAEVTAHLPSTLNCFPRFLKRD